MKSAANVASDERSENKRTARLTSGSLSVQYCIHLTNVGGGEDYDPRAILFGRLINTTSSSTIHLCRALMLSFSALALLGCSSESGEPVANKLQEQVAAVQTIQELNISLPLDLSPYEISVGARTSLRVSDRARVQEASGADGLSVVANAGLGTAYLGADSQVGDLVSVGSIDLRNRATVRGDATTAGTLQKQPGAQVLGQVRTSFDTSPVRNAKWTPEIPSGPGTHIRLEPDRQAILKPGTYGELSIKSRSTVVLAPGSYFFSKAFLEPDSKLVLSSTLEPTVIYVQGDTFFRGRVLDQQAPQNEILPLLVVALGQNQVAIDRRFLGTLYAPNAKISVSGGVHVGAFFGNEVELQPDARVVHSSFPWIEVLSPEVHSWQDAEVELVASVNHATGEEKNAEETLQQPMTFVVPQDIPLRNGNAGNGLLEFSFRTQGSVVVCYYRGEATLAHPTSLLERMLGRRYSFESCSNGIQAGQRVTADWFKLRIISADDQSPAARTEIVLSVSGAESTQLNAYCNDPIAPPLYPEEVAALKDQFSWHTAANLPETDPTGNPAVWHGLIYVDRPEQIQALDRLNILWSAQPLIEEFRENLDGKCGRSLSVRARFTARGCGSRVRGATGCACRLAGPPRPLPCAARCAAPLRIRAPNCA